MNTTLQDLRWLWKVSARSALQDLDSRSYAEPMTSVVVGEHAEFEAWLARRRAEGLDGRDEVWKGVYHVAPHEHTRNGRVAMMLTVLLDGPARAAGLHAGGSFNLGEPDDFRVPDLGYHRGVDDLGTYAPTAALVIEVLSPGDESLAKLPFYAERGVDEVWLVDPAARTVSCLVLREGDYATSDLSPLLGLRADDLAARLAWP